MANVSDPAWKPVPGYEGSYEVSSTGLVRSCSRSVRGPGGHAKRIAGTVLSPSTSKTGYKRVTLYKDGRQKTFGVHQIVLAAFVGPAPAGTETCHNDGNPANNHLENLRYDTKRANQLDRIAHGNNDRSNRERCPRGHALKVPNLRVSEWKKGHRECLSCARARNRKRQLGLTEAEFVELSHEYYVKIKAGS